ncbi:MAG: DUF2059 domain-containing protein [Hydrogenophaga sp.]|nr:DUF2059 domain-containing protein [Hydrogenophaga sp.]
MTRNTITLKAGLLALVGVLNLPLACAAGASATSVEQLVAINGAQKALETAVAGIENQVRQQVVASLLQQNGGRPLTPQQQTAVDKAVPGIGVVLRQEMGWPKMKDAYIKLYQDQLSQAEVERLTKLYQDPSYVTLMQKMGVINQQSAQLVSQKLPTITQRIQPVLEDALKQALGQ